MKGGHAGASAHFRAEPIRTEMELLGSNGESEDRKKKLGPG